MKHHWNWTCFFRDEIEPRFVINVESRDTLRKTCQRLLTQPFLQGLRVIVASVPAFSQQEWVTFCEELNAYRHHDSCVDWWLIVGQLIRNYLELVYHLLDGEIEQTLDQVQQLLEHQTAVEQFAMATCLHHFSQTNLKARMIFHHLLCTWDFTTRQLEQLQKFFQALSYRQKEVAVLTADGLTNQEIAELLSIDPKAVAEHLTAIFDKFQIMRTDRPSKNGTRYRLIHSLTYLLTQHPYLRF